MQENHFFDKPTDEQLAQLNKAMHPVLGQLIITKFIGAGHSGAVFELQDGRVIKLFYADGFVNADMGAQFRDNDLRMLKALAGTTIAGKVVPKLEGSGKFANPIACSNRNFSHWAVMTKMPGTPSYFPQLDKLDDEAWLDRYAESLAQNMHAFHATTRKIDGYPLRPAEEQPTYHLIERRLRDGFGDHQTFLSAEFKRIYQGMDQTRSCIVHNDLNFGNTMAMPDGRVTGLIDFGSCERSYAEQDFENLVHKPRLLEKAIAQYEKASGAKLNRELVYIIAGIKHLGDSLNLANNQERAVDHVNAGLSAIRCFNWLAENTKHPEYALLAMEIGRMPAIQHSLANMKLKPQELHFN